VASGEDFSALAARGQPRLPRRLAAGGLEPWWPGEESEECRVRRRRGEVARGGEESRAGDGMSDEV